MTDRLVLEMARAGALLAEFGTIRPGEGNLSVRLGPDAFLVTASGRDKGRLGENDFVVVRMDADEVPGNASCETCLHREVYRRREDVRSIVHAHPRKILQVAARGREAVEALRPGEGEAPAWLPRLEPGSRELALAASEALERTDSCVLSGHGVVTVAGRLETAVDRLLLLERLAEEVLG